FRDGSTDGLREIAILERIVCHKSPRASADTHRLSRAARSAAKLVDDPEYEADQDADDQAGHQRKVERGVPSAMDDDVPGQAAEAEGKLAAEIQQGANDD